MESDMEKLLTARWEAQLIEGQRLVAEAHQHLGWVANIYSGQLSITVLEDDVQE